MSENLKKKIDNPEIPKNLALWISSKTIAKAARAKNAKEILISIF